MPSINTFALAAILVVPAFVACSDDAPPSTEADTTTDTAESDVSDDATAADVTAADATEDTGIQADVDGDTSAACAQDVGEGLQTTAFVANALVSPIEVVSCTLSNGDEADCYRIEIEGVPADHEVGPFCPRNISDSADVGGLWIESGEVYDVDGAFIAGLAEFYNDDEWLLYDPATGDVNVTTTQEACEGAARPDVAEEYQNHCVECSLDYVDGGVSAEILIPVTPVARTAPSEIGNLGTVAVMLNGVQADPPAPVAAILGAHTIAAFDDCGGHVNPVDGYHYHAATGCSVEVSQCDGHAPLIGYALDGYALHAMTGTDGVEPTDLDACRGHEDADRGYHYHAAGAGENMFIGCLRGETVGTTTDGPGGDGPGGDTVLSCDDVPAGMPCCGDGVCDGPETGANCAADCA